MLASPNPRINSSMNETVTKWIIEFLLRQTIDDKIINGVLSCLPLSDNDNRLKKTILLRSIDLEASNGLVREKLLEYLEIIEELDHREGRKASNLMRGAYCAVAVDCTVRFLDDKMEDNAKYVETVERVWKSRVCKVKGLASEGLKRWLGELEEASKDEGVCEKICSRNTRNEALRAVKGYVKEAWKCMGPPFLEVMAAKAGDVVQEMCCGGGGGSAVVGSVNSGRNLGATQGIQDGQASVGRKHVSGKTRSIRPTRVIRRPRGAKISDPDDEDPEELMNVANDDPTSRMEKVQETHKFDSVQLHTRVNESHPDASQAAHNLPFIKAKDGANNRDAAKSMAAPVINVTPEVDASKSTTGELDAAATDPCPHDRNLSSTKAKENRSNVDAAKNKTVNRVQEASEYSSRELHAAVTDPFPEGPNLSFTKAADSTSNINATKKNTVPVSHATPEVNRVREALITSCRELREAVTDPLPEALKVAAALSRKRVTGSHETAVGNQAEEGIHAIPRVDSTQPASEPRSMKLHAAVQNSSSDASRPVHNVSSKAATNNMGNDPALANQTRDVPQDSTDKNIEYIDKSDEHNRIFQESGTHEQRKEQLKRKRSLMEPKGTAQTYEWDDSIDNSSTGSPEGPRLHSHSFRSRSSPLRVYAETKTTRRQREAHKKETKRRNLWTPSEVEALKDGVRRFGKGNWTDILHNNSTFRGKTAENLKDKWRNIIGRPK